MSTVIDIIFTGLIAFLPNSTDDPVSMKAYLLNAAGHKRTINVSGGDALKISGDRGTFGCSEVNSHGRLGSFVSCDLSAVGDVMIFFEPWPKEGRRYIRPGRPGKAAPANFEEKRNLVWLLRMENVQAGTGRVKTRGDIGQKVAVLFEFGWESAQVCALHGSETGMAKEVEFVPPPDDGSGLRQVVAESVMFTSRVKPGHLKIRIRKRGTRDEAVISTVCGRGTCLAVSLDNSMEASCEETPEAGGAPGGAESHFEEYYGLVRRSGEMRIPYGMDYGCIEDEDKYVDRTLFACMARLLHRAPGLAKCIREGFGEEEKVKQKDLHKIIEGCIAESSPSLDAPLLELRKNAARSLFAKLKVQDRLICPPTLLEP